MAANSGRSRGYTSADWNDFVHTGPGTLAGRYMRRFWHPVHRSADLAPGSAVPLRIMSEDFTLYRDAAPSPLVGEGGDGGDTPPPQSSPTVGGGGKVHLLAARCAHRGMLLHVGWVERDCIRCYFHGWKYDGSGQCVEQPGEDESFKEKIRIRTYPTEEYLGLIFAYLGEGEPPPLPRYADFEQEGVLETTVYSEACNYFQHIEDNPVHSFFVHGSRRNSTAYPKVSAKETAWGHAAYAEYEGIAGVRAHHRGMPTISNVVNRPIDPESGVRPTLTWTVPVDDERLVSFSVTHVAVAGDVRRRYEERREAWAAHGGRVYDPQLVDEVLAGRMRIEEVRKLADIDHGRVEDSVAYLGIGRIQDRSQEHLGRSDASTVLYRKIWKRELRALAEGRPLKQWVRTEGCVATEIRPWMLKYDPARVRG